MAKPEAHKWEFKTRFRRNAFGWRSQPAVARVKEAVAEIKRAAKKEPEIAAEGAVELLERLSPALEHVDSSSGAIGTAVRNAIDDLVPIITNAPASAMTRDGWLERLFEALQEDQIPYIESLGERWGELCVSKEVASAWADRLLEPARMVLRPRRKPGAHFSGTSPCLSALYHAGRHDELIELLRSDTIWAYKQWAVRALAAKGQTDEALRYAEACRNPWTSDGEVDSLCEEILLSAGLVEEAYRRYGISATKGGTYLATFRALARKYPQKAARELLSDLVKSTPGDEGKWFAAAKDAGLYDEALELATRSPCDPKTLTRAARDYAEKQPVFALGAGLLSLQWLVEGYGYEITGVDVRDAYRATLAAAGILGRSAEVKERIRKMVAAEKFGERFVTKVLGRELGL